MAGIVPSPGQAIYSAAKSGLRSYFSSMTSELSDRGIGATIACPGPLVNESGSGKGPRTVFGPSGLMVQEENGRNDAHDRDASESNENGTSTREKQYASRVSLKEAAELIARAAYHKVDECWIARHPVLLMGYLAQYVPRLSAAILKRIGPARVRQFRDGSGSGYDVDKMLQR